MSIIALLFPPRKSRRTRRCRHGKGALAPTTTRITPSLVMNADLPRGGLAVRQIRPYRPDPMTRVLRAALADTETTTLLPVITPDGPSAVRLGAPTVLVNDWRPTPAEPVMPPTPAARPPIWLDLADPWERLSRCRTIMRAPASPAPDLADQPWFREFDTSANDRSLRAFQEKFATRDRADVVLNADASPRTLVMTLAGDDQFGPRRPR